MYYQYGLGSTLAQVLQSNISYEYVLLFFTIIIIDLLCTKIVLNMVFTWFSHGFEHGLEDSFEHGFEHGDEHGFAHGFEHGFEHGFWTLFWTSFWTWFWTRVQVGIDFVFRLNKTLASVSILPVFSRLVLDFILMSSFIHVNVSNSHKISEYC